MTLIFFNCDEKRETVLSKATEFSLLTTKNKYNAGNNIMLKFKFTEYKNSLLVIENSFGIINLEPVLNDHIALFQFPEFIARKSGICKWSLVTDGKIQKEGVINILPNTLKRTEIETYLGPPSITAGNIDYSMHVIAPTDYTDNPLTDGTKVKSINQFENSITENEITVKNLLAWINIFSPKKSGRMLITASCNSVNAKELTTIIYPALATNFKISYDRNHDFADGNQVTVFSTDIIKDPFGNMVSDGTYVSFIITTSKNTQLYASGTTLNGIAQARFLHPFEQDEWSVKAFVTGAAESDTINLNFKAAVKDYELKFSMNNREIAVEKIESFMQQIVPDGIPIKLKVYDDQDELIASLNTTSRLGTGAFELEEDFYAPGTYKIEVSAAGIIKKMEISLK